MPANLSDFDAIPGMEGYFSATNGRLRCTAVSLKSGGICLHSPVADLGHAARSSLDKLGKVEFLLAPNHYHNKGLGEYAGIFPNARVVAPPASQPRLEKITGLAFEDLDTLRPELPDGTRFVSPAGLKNGEVWIVTVQGWIVVDAFAGPSGGDSSPRLLGTFPKYGIGDSIEYSDWVKGFILSNPPHILVPCHGDIIRNPDLPARLKALVERHLDQS